MSTEVAKQTNTSASTIVNSDASPSARFTELVLKEASDASGDLKLTDFQKKLTQNYFVKMDSVLKAAEAKRLAKAEKYRDPLEYIWRNVNINKLAQDVVAFVAIGLDPLQPNHINLIPYKNSTTNKFDVSFTIGYRGLEIRAMKYGFDNPDDIIIELVYENDKFKSFKKNKDNKVENYDFEIVDDFDRGEVKGGFYYHNYYKKPEKNKLRVFTLRDIEKRIPSTASAEFWGGEKDEYKNGVKTGNKIKVDGWRDEMIYKTIARAAYNDITIDSQKIDEDALRVMETFQKPEFIETEQQNSAIQNTIVSKANKKPIGFEEPKTEEASFEEVKEDPKQVIKPSTQFNEPEKEPVKQTDKKPAEGDLTFL